VHRIAGNGPPVTPGTAPPSASDRLRAEAGAVVAEAVGAGHRHDPVLPRTGGPAGNARLTAWTGLVLLVLFLAELITLLDVHGLISWHVALGVLLIPPALLKTASTGWRIVRYYSGNRPYCEAGPPPLFLRVLGPLVVAATLALLGSGLVLIALGEERARSSGVLGVNWVDLHQALFVVFAVLGGLHLLARLVPALALTTRRVRARTGLPARVAGGGRRLALVVLSLAVAGLTTALLLPLASSWQHEDGGHFRSPGVSHG
jgi:hypothetical protein